MNLSRRALLSGLGGAAFARAAWAQPSDGRDLVFRVLRNDGQIGTHRLTFAVTQGGLTVLVATDIKVGVGPITVYQLAK